MFLGFGVRHYVVLQPSPDPHSVGEQTQSLIGTGIAAYLSATSQPKQLLFESTYIVEYRQSFLEDFLIGEVYETKIIAILFPSSVARF